LSKPKKLKFHYGKYPEHPYTLFTLFTLFKSLFPKGLSLFKNQPCLFDPVQILISQGFEPVQEEYQEVKVNGKRL